MPRFLIVALLLPIFCNAQSVQNLDIKNGFLQFHLGDSISKYKEIVEKPGKNTPNVYRIRNKFDKLKDHLLSISLVVENDIITEIDVNLEKDDNITYMDDAMKKAYGEGLLVDDDKGMAPGYHKSNRAWEGKRVIALAKKSRFVLEVSGLVTETKSETIVFKKESDINVSGELNPDFQL
jgi:hypothetical protein